MISDEHLADIREDAHLYRTSVERNDWATVSKLFPRMGDHALELLDENQQLRAQLSSTNEQVAMAGEFVDANEMLGAALVESRAENEKLRARLAEHEERLEDMRHEAIGMMDDLPPMTTPFRTGTKEPAHIYKRTDEKPSGERFACARHDKDGPLIAAALNAFMEATEDDGSELRCALATTIDGLGDPMSKASLGITPDKRETQTSDVEPTRAEYHAPEVPPPTEEQFHDAIRQTEADIAASLPLVGIQIDGVPGRFRRPGGCEDEETA